MMKNSESMSYHSAGETVPVVGNSRKQITPSALMPINCRRALPSKWDEAERWITSPIAGDYSGKSSVSQPHGKPKPKSKSGPLGLSGHVYLSQYSPVASVEGYNFRNLTANSSLGTTVACSDNSVTANSVPSSQEAKLMFEEEEEAVAVYCRDVGTQMSPSSSPIDRSSELSLLNSVSMLPKKAHVMKDDVEVKNIVGLSSSAWTASRTTFGLRREEAKISAWENLQKAKAEAAIRELQMDLEKKRSASMDRISNKLRAAQKKAQDMRISLYKEQHPPRCSSGSFIVKTRRRFLLCSSCRD